MLEKNPDALRDMVPAAHGAGSDRQKVACGGDGGGRGAVIQRGKIVGDTTVVER